MKALDEGREIPRPTCLHAPFARGANPEQAKLASRHEGAPRDVGFAVHAGFEPSNRTIPTRGTGGRSALQSASGPPRRYGRGIEGRHPPLRGVVAVISFHGTYRFGATFPVEDPENRSTGRERAPALGPPSVHSLYERRAQGVTIPQPGALHSTARRWDRDDPGDSFLDEQHPGERPVAAGHHSGAVPAGRQRHARLHDHPVPLH